MDIFKTLRQLHEEKRRLDAAIARLEAKLNERTAKSSKRRGRKSMSAEERLRVSKRMTRYWRNRRAQAANGTKNPTASNSEPASA